ncbi:MAG: hypothetical protein ACTSPI_17585, partial [Candidatus Heimdallarchaeaceae archaeon]
IRDEDSLFRLQKAAGLIGVTFDEDDDAFEAQKSLCDAIEDCSEEELRKLHSYFSGSLPLPKRSQPRRRSK